MTRFARYSTHGIKKLPYEATPWAELAPSTAGSIQIVAVSQDQGKVMNLNKSKKSESDASEMINVLSKNDADNDEKYSKRTEKIGIDASRFNVNSESLNKCMQSKRKKGKGAPDNIAVVTDNECHLVKKKAKNTQTRTNKLLLTDVSEINVNNLTLKKVLQNVSEKSDPVEKKNENKTCMSVQLPKKTTRNLVLENDVGDILEENKVGADLHVLKPSLDDVLDGVTGDKISRDSFIVESNTERGKMPMKTTEGMPNREKKKSSMHKKKNNVHKKKKKTKMLTNRPSASGSSTDSPSVFTENNLMTQFEGYWVRRRVVPRLQQVRTQLAATISDPLTLKREMKKRKRAEHRLLLLELATHSSEQLSEASSAPRADCQNIVENQRTKPTQPKQPRHKGTRVSVSDSNAIEDSIMETGDTVQASVTGSQQPALPFSSKCERMVKFDGIWMTADAVGRLKELRRKLKQNSVSDVVLKQTLKMARRREEMMHKRQAKKVCLGCRRPGHLVSDCAQLRGGAEPAVTGICFRCGSTEHRLHECRHKAAAGEQLPYAVCFVCGQTGHLSRACSLNPNGVYPKGGACSVCRQRSHLADQCPERQQKAEEAAAGRGAPRLATLTSSAGVEDDYEHDFREVKETQQVHTSAGNERKSRVVTF